MKKIGQNLLIFLITGFLFSSCTRKFPENNWLYLLLLDSFLNNTGQPTTSGGSECANLTSYSIITEEDQTVPTSTFDVTLSSAPAAGNTVSIPVSSTDTVEGGQVGPADGTWVASFNLIFDDTTWNVPQTVFVKGVDDLVLDASLYTSYTVDLGAAVTADPLFTACDPVNVSAYNLDNEATLGPVSAIVSKTSIVTHEEQTVASDSFTVVLDTAPAPGQTVTIPITGNASEGQISSPLDSGWVTGPISLVFDDVCPGANCWSTAQTVFVKGVDDTGVDPSSFTQYTVTLGAATSGDSRYSGYNPPDVVGYNLDNDSPGSTSVIIVPTTGLFTTESGGTDKFGVVLDSPPAVGKNVVIDIASSATTEGTVSPASLTFNNTCPGANCWYSPQTVTVTGVDDLATPVIDIDTPYTIDLDSSTSTDTAYAALTPGSAALPAVNFYNVDNDSAGFTPSVTVLGTSELGVPQNFSVVLTSPPQAATTVVINVTTGDSTEGLVSPATLTFDNTNWNNAAAHTVTVTPQDDPNSDGPITYDVNLAIDTGLTTDANYDPLPNQTVSVTNTDSEAAAGFTYSATSGFSVSETGTTTTFSIILNTEPTGTVTVNLNSNDTSEATISPSVLNFDSTNWNNVAAHTVTVTGVDDFSVDGAGAWTIVTAAATSTDTAYNGLNPTDITGSTSDNDSAGITYLNIVGKTVAESGANDEFTVVLNSKPTANVVLTYNVPATLPAQQRLWIPVTGFTLSAVITFTPANWYIPQTISVLSRQDITMDRANPASGDPTFNVTSTGAVSGDGNYSGQGAISIPVTNIEDEKFMFVTRDAIAGTGSHTGAFDSDAALAGGYWQAYNGNANGAEEVDNYCMANAPPGVINGYKGVLGSMNSRYPTISIFNTHIKDWVLAPNTTYARANDGASLMTTNANSIFTFGTLGTTFTSTNHKYIWTGLDVNWDYSGWTCLGWTSGSAHQGWTGAIDSRSINDGGGVITCGVARPAEILCAEQ
ncbi:MAG: DUF1554 domain-containing protein [Spirochaetia bacterium]|nr:DUF1554 domain-containing protein [Spirochaetia bacterium]